MEWKTSQKMTPLDIAVTDQNLQTLKLLLPYTPLEIQPVLGVYIKLAELQNTFSYFRYFTKTSFHKKFSLENIMTDLKSYCSENDAEMMEQMLQALNMMEMMQDLNMNDLLNAMNINDIFQEERTESDGNMDGSSQSKES